MIRAIGIICIFFLISEIIVMARMILSVKQYEDELREIIKRKREQEDDCK